MFFSKKEKVAGEEVIPESIHSPERMKRSIEEILENYDPDGVRLNPDCLKIIDNEEVDSYIPENGSITIVTPERLYKGGDEDVYIQFNERLRRQLLIHSPTFCGITHPDREYLLHYYEPPTTRWCFHIQDLGYNVLLKELDCWWVPHTSVSLWCEEFQLTDLVILNHALVSFLRSGKLQGHYDLLCTSYHSQIINGYLCYTAYGCDMNIPLGEIINKVEELSLILDNKNYTKQSITREEQTLIDRLNSIKTEFKGVSLDESFEEFGQMIDNCVDYIRVRR